MADAVRKSWEKCDKVEDILDQLHEKDLKTQDLGLRAPDFDTFQQNFSNSLIFRIILRHPKLFLKKGLDLLLPLG